MATEPVERSGRGLPGGLAPLGTRGTSKLGIIPFGPVARTIEL